MNNKQNGGRLLEFRQRSANKHEFYKNTAGLRSGNCSDSESACLKVVSYVKVFELRGTVNENRFIGTFLCLDKRPNKTIIEFGLRRIPELFRPRSMLSASAFGR